MGLVFWTCALLCAASDGGSKGEEETRQLTPAERRTLLYVECMDGSRVGETLRRHHILLTSLLVIHSKDRPTNTHTYLTVGSQTSTPRINAAHVGGATVLGAASTAAGQRPSLRL